jgi:hypothetical protein
VGNEVLVRPYPRAIEPSALVQTLGRKFAMPNATDLLGFWLIWHLEGGLLSAESRSRGVV